MAAITAARNTLADGWTTMTNATNAAPANTTAVRGPTNTAVSSTAPQTIVTFAPETAVRCVSPDARNCAVASADSAEVSPRTRAGSIAAWSAGSASRAAEAKALRTRCPARWIGAASPSVGSPVADRTATVRSRRVGLEIRALNAAGWPAVSSANPTTDAKTTTRPDISSVPAACRDPRNINLPPRSDRGVSLGVTMTAVTSPKRSTSGWFRTCSTRSCTATAKPSPTNAIATTAAAVIRAPFCGARCLPPNHAVALAAATAADSSTTTPLIDHRIPAAVTAQLVSAAGTRRRSRWTSRPSAALTHGPGRAASPGAPARSRRRRQAGRRWRTTRWRRATR